MAERSGTEEPRAKAPAETPAQAAGEAGLRLGGAVAAGALVAAAATGAPVMPVEANADELRRRETKVQRAEGSTLGEHESAREAAASVLRAQDELSLAAHAILAQEGVLLGIAGQADPELESARRERVIATAALHVPVEGDEEHVPEGQRFWNSVGRLAAASADYTMLGGYSEQRDSSE